jgi:adenine-specific DNA-methyltransferase
MNFIINETAQKLRGGYYTPVDLAAFIARWVKEISPKTVLEPSCGDGAFFRAFKEVSGFSKTQITGFELDEAEASKAKACAEESGLANVSIRNQDFLEWGLDQMADGQPRFDAVVGNPPFVRYQYLPAPFQVTAEKVFRELDLKFTKHTNAWVSFILASMAILRPGGRLAMVVPAEIIHVTHAQSLRSYLGRECRRLVIIDPEELWFDGTLQGAVILLAEKRRTKAQKAEGLGMYPVKGREFLRLSPSDIFDAPQAINGKTVQGKWTRALLDRETRDLFDELADHHEVFRFDEIAKVDVGIVTGANKFFLVDDAVVRTHKLSKWAHPMFGRSDHCPGVIYDEAQHAANAASGKPTNFLWFQERGQKVDAAAKAYIKRAVTHSL